MNPNGTIISHTVMQRVRRIQMLRTAAIPALSSAVFLGALWGVGREVWVAKVFENMSELSTIQSIASFSLNAFLGTDLSVQLLVIVASAAFIWFARSITTALPMPRFA